MKPSDVGVRLGDVAITMVARPRRTAGILALVVVGAAGLGWALDRRVNP